MIPALFLTEWANHVRWIDEAQVEQDLVISRALVEIFSDPFLSENLAFRGGTALHKIFFEGNRRYSEDIDLCRTTNGPIGPLASAIKARLNPWLGEPQTERTQFAFKLNYRFMTEVEPVRRMKLKVEINVRETFNLYGLRSIPFTVTNPWFTGVAGIRTYLLEELLATKLRALYQRDKGRDLFDLFVALTTVDNLDRAKVVEGFKVYIERQNLKVSRAEFEKNLELKLTKPRFLRDMPPLLPKDAPAFDAPLAYALVTEELVSRLDL